MLLPRQPAEHRAPRAARAAASAALGLLAVTVTVTACGNGGQASQASGRSAAPSSSRPPSSGQAVANNTGLCSSAASLDSLTVRRTDVLPGNHTKFSFPATTSAHDPARVQAVARTLCGLKTSHGAVACPAAFGVSYRLSFAAGGRRFAPVTVTASGCQVARGLGAPRTVTSAGLWQTLGVAIGIPHPGNAAFRGTVHGGGMNS